MSIRRRCGPSPRRPRIGALIAPDSRATVSDHCASLSDTWKSEAISGMSGAPREETTATISVTTTSTGVSRRSRSDSARIDAAVSVLATALPGTYRRVTPASATLLNRRKPPFPGQEYRRGDNRREHHGRPGPSTTASRCPRSDSASSRRLRTRPATPCARRSARGYRHIDTAAAYGNERQVGEAVHGSGLDRSEVFLETKIWISDYGYDETLHGFEKSAGKLGVDQVDLLILHQALPSEFDRTLDAYRALETLLADEKVRAIGVSNFMVEHLTALARSRHGRAGRQPDRAPPLLPAARRAGVRRRARHPDSGLVTDRRDHLLPRQWPHAALSMIRVIGDIAGAHGKTPAQVMLRWGLQHGRSVIPKSTRPSRIAENIDVFDFELSADEMRRDRRPRQRPSRRPRARRDHPGGIRPRDPRGRRNAPERARTSSTSWSVCLAGITSADGERRAPVPYTC